jgi:hypothetical protein
VKATVIKTNQLRLAEKATVNRSKKAVETMANNSYPEAKQLRTVARVTVIETNG